MKSFLRSLVERLVFAIFSVSGLLELCTEEIGKDAPFVSLSIYNKVSLLSSDVILFLFFRPAPSLSTFPKTFLFSSNYSFQSLVGIYFYITFALAFAFFVVFAYRNRSLEDLHRERQVVRYAVLLICFI